MPYRIIKDLRSSFFSTLLRPTPPWKVILSLIVFLSICFVTGLGKILILFFPASSFAVGVFLYLRYPSLYVGFVFWMWFLSPLIRRLIDYQSGYFTPGPWTFTALIVTSISFFSFLKEFPKTYHKNNLPFTLCFGALFYALSIGLIQNSIDQAIVNFLAWLCPISFGFYLYANWKYYPQYRKVIQQSFLWGMLILGVYGILQFCLAPQWDRFWLINGSMGSFGQPEPFGIRVMSTMSSPQAFATTMMAGLILLFTNKQNKILFFSTNIIGYLTFLLSQARAAWLAWGVAVLIFISFVRSSTQIKVIIGIALIVLAILPLINMEPLSDIILSRLETLSDAGTDSSLNTRLSAYQNLFNLAITEVTGKGLGFRIDLPGYGDRDGGILPTLFIFGWLGTIPFLCGFCLLFLKIIYSKTNKFDTFNTAAKAICLGVLSQIGFNFIFLSTLGMLLWSFMGMSLAGQKYYLLSSKFLRNTEQTTFDAKQYN